MKSLNTEILSINDESYQLLVNAIIIQAVKDYRKALKYDHRGIKRECCRFFRSDWFKTLTAIDGEMLISRIKSEVQ